MKVTGSIVIVALIALTVIGGALYTVIFVIGGSPDIVLSRASIISALLAPTILALVSLLRQEHTSQAVAQTQQTVSQTQTKIEQVQENVNGHLEQHRGHTDAEIRQMVDQMMQQYLNQQTEQTSK